MPPAFTDQDPLDLEIDRFLSSLPPIGAPTAAPVTDPLDQEIDSFLASLPQSPTAKLREPIVIDPAATLRPGAAIDVERTLGPRSAAVPPRASAPEPTLAQKFTAVPAELSKSALTSFVRTQTEPAIAGASMVYPRYADTFQAVRQHEQQNPILPMAETGELAVTDPRWWAQIGGQALGSAAGLAVAGRAGGAAGFGAIGKAGLASVPEALAEAGSTFNDVLGQTGDQQQAFTRASEVYAANMALLGLTNTPLFQQGGKLLRRSLGGAAIEGSQEVGQQAIGNVATGRPALEGAAEAAVAGALAGGGFRAIEGRPRPPIPLAPATFPPPLAQRPTESPQAASVVDPVDQQIDAFLGSLPPVKQSGQFDQLRKPEGPARGSLEAAIVEQFGGQVTDDQVQQLAAQARSEEGQSAPDERRTVRPPDDRPFEVRAAEDAIYQGRRGTPEEVQADIVRRARELYEAEQGSGAVERTPKALLEAIRDAGGIHVDDADLGGELRRLKEFNDHGVNSIGGVQGVRRRGGMTLDDMAVHLSRERGWQDIVGPAELVDAIEDAAIAARAGRGSTPKFDVEHYAIGAGVKPGSRWWVTKAVPRNDKLTGDDAAVQERAASALEQDWDGFRQRYDEKFGVELNADNASELFDDYAKSKDARSTLVRAVRAPAAALVEDLYARKLEEPTAEGKEGVVVFTGGGNGSGKSSSLDDADRDGADIIFDSTMSEFESTRKKIDAALESGRFVELRYVYRDPVAAFERGVLPRAKKTGRTVPIPTHVNTHISSLRVVQQLAEHYADDPAVGIKVFEAVEGPTPKSRFELQPTTLDALAAKEYPDPSVLRRQLQDALGRADVSAAIRQGTDLSPRAPGAADTERAAGFAPIRGAVGSGAGGRGIASLGDARDTSASARPRGGLPPVLGESRGRSRLPIPLKQAEHSAAPKPRLPVKLRADLDEGIGSPTRRVFEEAPDPAVGAKPPKKPISESQAVEQLRTIFGHDKPPTALERIGLRAPQRTALPTKTGRFREKAFGIYKIEPQVIRLKRFGDLATFTHELGHHIDFGMFSKGGRPGGALFADELERLGESTSPKGAGQDIRMAEGVAEFFRLYFPDPEKARRAAPQFAKALEEVLAANPTMAKQFEQGRNVVQAYLAQDHATRGAARVDHSRREADEDPRTLTQRLEVAWVDDLADLRRAVETLSDDKPVPYKENAYFLARLARGAAGKASGFLQFGPRRDDGTFLGGSFAEAIAPVRGRLKEFSQYLIASRVPELRGRQIETGMTTKEAEALVAKLGSPEFEKARDALYAYQDAVLEYAVQGGALSADLAARIRELNRFYVPFHRLLSDEPRAGVARRIADRTLPIKKIRGSGRDIIDPLESIIKNTHAIVDMVEKNKAMRALVKHATSTEGGGQYIEAIPQPKVATKFNLGQLERPIRDAIDDAGLDASKVDLDQLVTVFTPASFSMPGQDLVTVVDGGKRTFYAVNDKALYQAITQIGARPSMVLGALLAKPASALRAGATLTLGFIGRNPIRDTFVAAVQSRHGFKPGVDTLRGLFHYLKKDGHYQEFLNSGAAGAALVSGDRKVLQAELRKYADAGTLKDHLRDVVAHPIDALRALSEATEVATRLGEFMRATQKEGRTAEGFARAGLAARDVTLDFSRAGTAGREWNAYSAFFNAQIQGYDRLARTFRTDPVGATIRATASITLMSIATWALNHDDEEWRELPEWEKSTYWHIPLKNFGGDGWMRLPKPFELGAVFGTFFEKALDHITGEDPHAFKRLFADDPNVDVSKLPLQTVKNAAAGVLSAVTPTAVLPWLEVQANYSTFRGRSIVSPFDTDLDPALQFNRWTSETAKAIGKALDYSPAKIDHLVYGYGAGLARGVVGGVEGAAKRVFSDNAAPASGASKLPGVGAFVRDVAGSDAESLAEFYRRRDALEGAAGSAKRYKVQGAVDEQQRIKLKFPTLDADRKKFRRVAEDLKDLRDQVDAVFKDSKLDADAKRDQLDRIYERMVNTAREALGKKPLPSRFSGKMPIPLARR